MVRNRKTLALVALVWMIFSATLPALKAATLPSGYTISSTGTNWVQPKFAADGSITQSLRWSVGDYSIGYNFSDPNAPNVRTEAWLHRTGSDENLLPESLASPYTVFRGLNSSGNLIAVGRNTDSSFGSVYFSLATGQITYPTSNTNRQGDLQLNGINSLNQLVGTNGSPILFASPNAIPVDLSMLIPLNSGWRILTASDINDRGEILGSGVDPQRHNADFLLTPLSVPEPCTLVLYAGMILALVSLDRKSARNSRGC